MKRNIIFFVNSLSGGGAEKILQTVLKYWDTGAWNVTIYSIKKEEIPPEYPKNVSIRFLFDALHEEEGKLACLKVKIKNSVKLWVYKHLPPSVFYRLYVRGSYDVEAAFIEGYATRIASGSRNARSRKLAWVHIDLAANHWTLPVYRSVEEEQTVYRWFDTVVSVSRNVQESIVSLMGPLKNARVLHNPVDLPLIREKSLAFAPVRPQADMVFCASGRLVHQKAFDRLVTVFRYLDREGFSFHLWILGDGPEKKKLAGMIETSGLQEKISLLGYQENPYPYVRTADWVVCSSRSEGYSTVISESLILGTPVVSTLCSGVDEQLNGGEFGVVTENHALGLYLALKDILTGRTDRKEFAERARRGGERFDLDKLMEGVRRLIDDEL